jgi:hypothetical protein
VLSFRLGDLITAVSSHVAFALGVISLCHDFGCNLNFRSSVGHETAVTRLSVSCGSTLVDMIVKVSICVCLSWLWRRKWVGLGELLD